MAGAINQSIQWAVQLLAQQAQEMGWRNQDQLVEMPFVMHALEMLYQQFGKGFRLALRTPASGGGA